MAEEPRLLYRDMRSRAEELLDEAVKKRILKGLEALHVKYGPNWVNLCDPDELCMSDGEACVLGQVYGDFTEGAETLFSVGENADRETEECGFVILHEYSPSEGVTYSDLDEGWKRVLAES